ncbi:helix-turn-helix domain-containing protein [Companilactobacillus hulinensis]|uniref:helix-turn-helix domain-containing protein n=1 Tax=Companilactobacillus hulinensis TaxID=2486007 RepID=UPI000F76BA12|nr:helix-turn-helix transcriptional regulator [Companilactobacillus hulinensis]
MLLGQVIQDKRKSLNLNQTELADGICTQAIISKIENQNISPSISVLISICQKLQLTLNEVFSEFSSLPSSNLYLDKFKDMDEAFQDHRTEFIHDTIPEIKESALPSSEKAHLHFLLALISESNNDSEEAIFQLSYSLELLSNRKTFWGTILYAELGIIYHSNNQSVKTDYYFDLAYSSIDNLVINSSSEYYYYRRIIVEISDWYTKNKQYGRSNILINAGLHKFPKYFTAEFTDTLFYLSAINTLNIDPIDYNKLSHSLTTAIAFAEYNNNQPLLDKVKQVMESHNINELKIKP